MLALREGFLVIQSFIVMSEKRLFLAWNQNILRNKYSIFNMIIPNSVVVFFTFAPTSFDDTDLIIARL